MIIMGAGIGTTYRGINGNANSIGASGGGGGQNIGEDEGVRLDFVQIWGKSKRSRRL